MLFHLNPLERVGVRTVPVLHHYADHYGIREGNISGSCVDAHDLQEDRTARIGIGRLGSADDEMKLKKGSRHARRYNHIPDSDQVKVKRRMCQGVGVTLRTDKGTFLSPPPSFRFMKLGSQS